MMRLLKAARNVLLLPFAIIVAIPVVLFIVVAIIVTLPRSLWSSHRWRQKLRRDGRYKNPAIQPHSLSTGTLIVDSPIVGWNITQCWWTPDNVLDISPEPIPTDTDRNSHIRNKTEQLELSFDRWVSKRYLDANAGTAVLIGYRGGDSLARQISRRTNIPVVKSRSGPIALHSKPTIARG